MTSDTSLQNLANNPSCMDDYDPNAMHVAKAREFIWQFLNPVSTVETLALRDSLGRVLATDITSPANVPNYDNSAMDGYALKGSDIATSRLKVIGTAFAGRAFDGTVHDGECVRIMTGAAMPAGTDTVVVQERTVADGEFINISEAPKPQANVRYAGEDLKLGQTVLAQGHLMRPADLGLIASLGIAEVQAYRKLKVAFFSTGDELVSIGQPLSIGQVYDSNRYTLFGMLTRLGVEIIDMGAIADDPILLEATLLNAAQQADVVITSGGVSVGEADYMKQLLTKHGQVMFWKVSMKPGRPLAYGKVGNAHYFGLPGNPVAVMVTFYQFVRDALLRLMGQSTPVPLPMFQVQCTQAIKKLTGRTEFQRGLLFTDADGVWRVKPTGAQGSALLSSMSLANCFIVLDDTVGNLEAGATVQVQVLDGII
ncbi:gephyrin-like molybdotransferase Glp [Methylotenera mobilis]|uniref:Molybdopterin molybdenumtransferase n=1 Tax=Methylotenera mobilis (strain JLW8 / ATCC BAA-1282 / DSM 17540) TaxID=583345 RepID=C6WYZ2_METML|nr:gephyrin-like molybdotransferase Glp [Methylotenera mobilis]ACT48940.1 molybdenum cofactor synthesis domain protein [Methylotenera mobilis JLW8]